MDDKKFPPRPPKKEKLQGKNVFIIGDPHATLELRASLEAKGAQVSYSRAKFPTQPGPVMQEMLRLKANPDVILMYEPRLDEGRNFKDHSAVVLAKAIKELKIPILVVDDYKMGHSEDGTFEKAILKGAGADFRPIPKSGVSANFRAEIVTILGQMVSQKTSYKGGRSLGEGPVAGGPAR